LAILKILPTFLEWLPRKEHVRCTAKRKRKTFRGVNTYETRLVPFQSKSRKPDVSMLELCSTCLALERRR
jgi:hypothetical protein